MREFATHRYVSTEADIAENIRMNAIQRERDERARSAPQSKSQSSVTIPPRSKEQEIENLKRLLANISQRLDALKVR